MSGMRSGSALTSLVFGRYDSCRGGFMTENVFDVVVAGAGFAGAAAASVLCEAGLKVAVIEARDRVGGRALTRPIEKQAEPLELGGSWIAPWHQRIRHYVELHKFKLRPTLPVVERRWHTGNELRSEGPAPPHEYEAYEAGLSRINADVRSLSTGHLKDSLGHTLTEVTMNAYLHRIDANQPLRAQAMAWWCISGNGDPDEISAAEFLSSCAYGNGTPEGMMQALGHTINPGAQQLVEEMLSRGRTTLKLGSRVDEIRQFNSGVLVTCDNGEFYRARGVVLALPLNVLANIRFAPALERRKSRAISIGHGGRAFKIWARLRGLRPGLLVTGGLAGLQWAFAEREGPNRSAYVVGFGLMDGKFDPSSAADMHSALRRFFPECEVLAFDWHDWVGDPYSRGTWVALPAKDLWIGDSSEWQNEGRIYFASADYSPSSPGWFESAVVSGEAAALQMLQMFAEA